MCNGIWSVLHPHPGRPLVLVAMLRMDAMLQGNINLIEAAAKKAVKKFVLVTSIGTGDSKDAPPTQVYDVLKPVLLEKEKAEEALKVRQPALGQATTTACNMEPGVLHGRKVQGRVSLSSSLQRLLMPSSRPRVCGFWWAAGGLGTELQPL